MISDGTKSIEDARQEGTSYEAMCRDIFANMRGAFLYGEVVTDRDGRPMDAVFLDMNHAYEMMVGVKREDIVGKRATEIFQAIRDISSWLGPYARAALDGEMNSFEQFYPEMDKWHLTTVYSPQKGYFIALFEDITDRKRAEEALIEERDRLSSLINSMSDEVWFADAHGNVIMVNAEVPKKFGYVLPEGGQEIKEVAAQLEVYRPDGTVRSPEEAPLLRALRNEHLHEHEEIIRSPATGVLRHRQVNASPVIGPNGEAIGSVAVIRDITDRKRMEEALRESEAHYKHLLEHAPTAIYKIDFRSSRLKNVNDAMCLMSGYSRDELLSMSAFELLDDESKRRFRERVKRLFSGEDIEDTVDYTVIRKDGRKVDAILNIKFDYEGGQPVGALVVGYDITERKRAEENLKRSNAELQQFAYIASHDLQEPLRMITSYIGLLEKKYGDQLPAQAREYMGHAVDGSMRMKRLIDDFLHYSRVDSRPIEKTQVEMSEVMKAVVNDLRISISEVRAELIIGPLLTVYADQVQMKQVLMNLLSNAIKFHSDGRPIAEISATAYDGEFVFSVKDNGIGIDPNHANRLFRMFSRLHTREEYPGTGIGLAIAKKNVERHGGRIWFESEPGKGTTFFFTIPI